MNNGQVKALMDERSDLARRYLVAMITNDVQSVEHIRRIAERNHRSLIDGLASLANQYGLVSVGNDMNELVTELRMRSAKRFN